MVEDKLKRAADFSCRVVVENENLLCVLLGESLAGDELEPSLTVRCNSGTWADCDLDA